MSIEQGDFDSDQREIEGSKDINEVTSDMIGVEVERAKVTSEEEAENLERGKGIAMSKVKDWQVQKNFFHGTPALNFESLVIYGPDPNRAEKSTRFAGQSFDTTYHFHPGLSESQYFGTVVMIVDPENAKKFIPRDKTPLEQFDGVDILREGVTKSRSPISFGVPLLPDIFSGIVIEPSDPHADRRTENYRVEIKGRGFISPALDRWDNTGRRHYEKIYQRWVCLKMVQIAKGHPERSLPVYDKDGNLLWPQKMTRGEIAQKEAEKKKS